MRPHKLALSSLTLAAAMTLGGCASFNSFYGRLVGQQPEDVSPNQFAQPPSHNPGQVSGIDQPGALNPENPRIRESFQPAVAPLPAAPLPPEKQAGLDRNLLAAEQSASTQPSAVSTSATTAPSVATGEYLQLGGVVAEVNGTPIYINKVLTMIWPGLHNNAATMEPDRFRLDAFQKIQDARDNLIAEELQFAAAQHTLADDDKRLVSALTASYRQDLITQAGGSVEVARRNAAAMGENFDEKVEDKFREYMTAVYHQRKFVPLLAPSAQEMRAFYQANADQLYTQHSEAVFDMLKIDPSLLNSGTAAGDRALAFSRAKQAHDRAAAGQSFATIFAEFNNDDVLRSTTNNTGNMGSHQRGSFAPKAYTQVEDAVWALQPTQVTDVLEIDGSLYIGKLESRTNGSVKPFEDEEVQTDIADRVSRERFHKLLNEEEAKLEAEAIVQRDDDMVRTALDMAMRSYAEWSKK